MRDEKAETNGEVFEFAGFRLDSARNLLLRNDEPEKLTAKAVELLAFLVKNNRRVVSKDEILDAVWAGSFVEEANLTVHISTLRKLLGATNGSAGDDSVKIETFPKIGYRFSADVRVLTSNSGANGSAQPSPTIPDLARRRWPRYIIGLCTILVLLAPVYLGFRWLRTPTLPTITRLNGFEGATAYSVSPDGQYAAQAVPRDGKSGLTMVHLGSNSRIQLVEPGIFTFHGLKFSRDGNLLYFVRTTPDETTSLYRTPILNGEPVKLLANVAVQFGVSPTNDRICFIRQTGRIKTELIVTNIDGTGERILKTREGEETYWPWSIDWSPDGRRIATSVHRGGQNAWSRIVTVDVGTGQEEAVTGPVFGAGGGEGLAWLPDGSGIIYSGGDLVEGRSQIWHVEYPSGVVRRLTNDVEAYGYPVASKDGKVWSAQFEDSNAIWVDRSPYNSAVSLRSPFKHSLNWVRTNARGHIVFGSNARGNRDVWIVNSDGSGERQLTQNAGSNIMPVPSEDGQFVVFASNRAARERYNLWRMDLSGGDVRQLTNGAGEVQPTISPDGQWVYYSTGGVDGGHAERTLWRVSAAGGEPEKLVDGIAHGADVSPDGKFFAAWYKLPDSGWKLAIFEADGGSPLKLFDAEMGVPVKWIPNGKAVAYRKTVDGVSNIWMQPVDGSSPVQVTGYRSMRILNFDWAADDRIVTARNERTSNLVVISDFR